MKPQTKLMLSLEHVSKCFGREKVLIDFSLAVCEGEFFTLLGLSGCGKTTLLRLFAGFEQAIKLYNKYLEMLKVER